MPLTSAELVSASSFTGSSCFRSHSTGALSASDTRRTVSVPFFLTSATVSRSTLAASTRP